MRLLLVSTLIRTLESGGGIEFTTANVAREVQRSGRFKLVASFEYSEEEILNIKI